MSTRMTNGFSRVFGPLPPKDAPKVTQLIYVRRFWIRSLAILAVPYVLAFLVVAALWFRLILGVGALCWVIGFVSANVELRRARLREE
jgi:hypothetical protein